MTDNVRRGRDAESRAADFLMKKGYKIIRRNYQIRGGEIDLIAKDGDWLVFIEVKMRSSDAFGTGAEAVTKKKQQAIVRTACRYIYENNCAESPMRFDVLELTVREGRFYARHIINAFLAN